MFDGRIAEDFKLRTGTWVHVGVLRIQLLAACDPLVQDAVLTGHDRDEVGALLFLQAAATALPLSELHERIGRALASLNASHGGGSATRITRALIQHSPARADAGEITDKGYINQRAVLTRRSAEVERLYIQPCDADVIVATQFEPTTTVST